MTSLTTHEKILERLKNLKGMNHRQQQMMAYLENRCNKLIEENRILLAVIELKDEELAKHVRKT